MQAMSKSMRMEAAFAAIVKIWPRQKVAQYQDTFGRGGAWLPVRILITKDTTADCKQAEALMTISKRRSFWRTVVMTRMRL